MVPYEWSHVGQSRVLSNHVSTNVRVATHDLPLFFGERACLIKDVVPHADLAEVMKRPCCPNGFHLAVTELQQIAQARRELGDANRVRFCVSISSVERLCRELQSLILEHGLALSIRNVSSDRQDEA